MLKALSPKIILVAYLKMFWAVVSACCYVQSYGWHVADQKTRFNMTNDFDLGKWNGGSYMKSFMSHALRDKDIFQQ